MTRLGRREDALKATEEAVDITRALAADQPDAFLPDLARSLGVVSQVYADALFKAQFAVAPDGMVEMLDDEPVAADLGARVSVPILRPDSRR